MRSCVRGFVPEARVGRSNYAREEKSIGHVSFPKNEYSLTVSKIKGDVYQFVIELVQEFCIKGNFYREVFVA